VSLFWHCYSVIGGQPLRHSLPRAGGFLDQDHATMEAFKIIEMEVRSTLNPKEEKQDGGK